MDYPDQLSFSQPERDLMADIARRVLPNLDHIAERWAEAIQLNAPADKVAGMRQTLRSMSRPLLSGFFTHLAEGDPERALSYYQSFIEDVVRERLDEPERQRTTIEGLLSSARIMRSMLALETDRVFAGNKRRAAAMLPFARLWSQVVESTGLTYARLREDHLGWLYEAAQPTAEKLRESEERFRLLVEESKGFAIWTMDQTGCIASWNRGGDQLLGYATNDILGQHLECLFALEERAASTASRLIEGARGHGRMTLEVCCLRKDGSKFYAHLAASALHDAQGRLLGFSAICRDISKARRREQELTVARDAALEASRLKSAFLANITHEIHTPLNILLGYADLMAERLEESGDPRAGEYVAPVRRAGKRLLDTVGSILELSKIEAGSFSIDPRPILLGEFIERLVAEFRILAAQKGLAVSAQIDAPDAMVRFDEACLSNLLTNLLQNAIKFTERGEIALRLWTDERATPMLEVRDTGVGIDPAYLPHIFDAFTQENPGLTRRFQGVGLGLSLVRKYVELHGAEIAVTSEKNHGSSFVIRFARDPDAA